MKRPLCLVCFVYVLAVVLHLYLVPMPSFSLPENREQTVTLSGQIKQIEYQSGTTRIYLHHITCDSSQTELYSQLNTFPQAECICYLKEDPQAEDEEDNRADIGIGSCITVTGRIGLFSGASNPGEFDYQAYLASEHILFGVWDAYMISLEADANWFLEGLFRIRQYGGEILARYLPEADAGILKAMLLGDRTELTEADSGLFRKSGTAHILAISGVKMLSLVSHTLKKSP